LSFCFIADNASFIQSPQLFYNNRHIDLDRGINIYDTKYKNRSDSIELLTLIRNMYSWYGKQSLYEFYLLSKDTLYIGIDWNAHKIRLDKLTKTNFFAKEFLDFYNDIAIKIDSFIKKSKQTNNHGIPDFILDANIWCICSTSPDSYLKDLTLTNLKIYPDSAAFKWKSGELYVNVKTVKESNIWRIASLEGFILQSQLIDSIARAYGR